MSDSTEWEGIFYIEGPETRPVMSAPPRVRATTKFVREVAAVLDMDPTDRATLDAADWIADKMERFGAHFAQPVFDTDGTGPLCSFCDTIWPLCGHHHLSGWVGGDDSDGAA